MQSFRLADSSPSYKLSIAAYSLQSERFTRLEQLLAAEQWQEANEETFAILAQICGLTSERTVKIGNLSCYDLHMIDSLWLKYSHGRFGFRIQQRIWQQTCGEEIDYSSQNWCKFCDRIGWNRSKFDQTPAGHFPFQVAMSGKPEACFEVFDRLYSRLEVCQSSA